MVASLVYVLVWELYLALTDYAFIDAYIHSIVESRQTGGASQAELAAAIAESETIRQQYANPLFRLPMTCRLLGGQGLAIPENKRRDQADQYTNGEDLNKCHR